MDGAHTGQFKFLKGTVQAAAVLRKRGDARLLDLAAKSKLHLAGRLLCDRPRHDPAERASARPDEADDPAHQRGGLAGACRRLDEEAGPELRHDAASVAAVI